MYGHKKCRYRFAASYRFVILDTANVNVIFILAKYIRSVFFYFHENIIFAGNNKTLNYGMVFII